jgi:hypothetical protein
MLFTGQAAWPEQQEHVDESVEQDFSAAPEIDSGAAPKIRRQRRRAASPFLSMAMILAHA